MSLQRKILSYVLVLGFLSAVLTISVFNHAMDLTLTGQLVQIAKAEALDLSSSVVAGLLGRDENQMLRVLQASQKVTSASYLTVLDNAGLVLAHTNVTETGHRYASSIFRQLIEARGVFAVRQDGPSPAMLISAPIWVRTESRTGEEMLFTENDSEGKTRMGTVVIAVPLNQTVLTRARIIHQLIWITGIIGAFGVGTAVWLIRGIMRPVRFLMEGTAKISTGEYGIQIPVTRKDELGQLADDFNRMSKILFQTTISKDFMTSVFTHMTEPLLVIGNDGLLKMCNGATLRLLGYTEEELVGQPAVVVLMGVSGASAGNAPSLLPAKDLDIEFVSKSGVKMPVVYSCALLMDGNGATAGSIIIARDMTERQRLETAMRCSEKMSAVGQLAAGVAHEINNPLGVILGYAQALVRRLAPADPMETPLKSIEKEAVRCKNLVQDLLTFSRVSKVEREPIDINNTVTAALSLVIAQAKIGQVTVEKILADGLPRILGNTNQIQQIIINLATNAMDAIGHDGSIQVTTEALEEGPLSWVCLKVIDSGSGIPTDIQSRIFEPFYTTKPVGKGTGLGLSLVHEIVMKHSGMIDVQSRPGRTEFCVKFPARLQQRVAA